MEKELLGHRKQWEEALRSVEEHKTAVEALAAERDQLSRDVKQREQRVAELEALLQEVCQNCESVCWCSCSEWNAISCVFDL